MGDIADVPPPLGAGWVICGDCPSVRGRRGSACGGGFAGDGTARLTTRREAAAYIDMGDRPPDDLGRRTGGPRWRMRPSVFGRWGVKRGNGADDETDWVEVAGVVTTLRVQPCRLAFR